MLHLDESVVEDLRTRYNHVHPLLFARSVTRAKSEGELFDILCSMPEAFPVIWSDEHRRWVKTNDICQSENFDNEHDEID